MVIWSNKLLTILHVWVGGNVLLEQEDASTVAWKGKKDIFMFSRKWNIVGEWTEELVKMLKTKFSLGIWLVLCDEFFVSSLLAKVTSVTFPNFFFLSQQRKSCQWHVPYITDGQRSVCANNDSSKPWSCQETQYWYGSDCWSAEM